MGNWDGEHSGSPVEAPQVFGPCELLGPDEGRKRGQLSSSDKLTLATTGIVEAVRFGSKVVDFLGERERTTQVTVAAEQAVAEAQLRLQERMLQLEAERQRRADDAMAKRQAQRVLAAAADVLEKLVPCALESEADFDRFLNLLRECRRASRTVSEEGAP